MKPFKGLVVFALAVLLFTSCSTTAHIEKDESTDLTKYKSYTWIPMENTEAKKNQLSDIAAQNIKNSVNQELQKNGWKEVKSNPDVLVSYDVMVENNTRVDRQSVYSRPYSRPYYNPYTRRYGMIHYPSQFLGYENSEVPVKEGTVTISLVDPKQDKTVWQGWATDEINSSKLTSKDIERNVKSIFKKFSLN
jgi:hypothetical protein